MFASLYAKLIAAAVLLIALATAVVWFGAHERGIGAASVQAKWDAANSAQATVAVEASETARSTEQQQSNDFAGIAAGYLQVTSHAYPSLSDALPAAVDAGTVQLRDACPSAAGSGNRAEAAARARRADAAVTQALADRVAHSIAAVRAGDDADKREADFRALILAQRAMLMAERKQRN